MPKGSMTLEESARRMERLLAKRPRRAVTRSLLASLPKRDRVRVSVSEYASNGKERFKRARLIARRLIREWVIVSERAASQTDTPRKDRRRPRAVPKRAARWKCRPTGNRQRDEGRAVPAERPQMTWEEAFARKSLLVEIQGNNCALCGGYLTMEQMADPVFRPSIDHVHPRFSGGPDEGNIVAAHNRCNGDKSNDLPTGCELIWLCAVNARLSARNSA